MSHPLLMALFADVASAAAAARDAHALGVDRADLSVVARDHQDEERIAQPNRRKPRFGDRGFARPRRGWENSAGTFSRPSPSVCPEPAPSSRRGRWQPSSARLQVTWPDRSRAT